MDTSNTNAAGPTTRYRIVIGGRVAADWVGWFEADTLAPMGENTVLEVHVADQAELYGRLRRIHDLHLKLISITQIDASAEEGEPPPDPNPRKATRSNPHE